MEPAKQRHRLDGRTLHHGTCGGVVSQAFHHGSWNCEKCNRFWKHEFIANLNDQQMGDRFYILPLRAWGEHTLVYKVEGKDKFLTCVPSSEAHLYEKWKP